MKKHFKAEQSPHLTLLNRSMSLPGKIKKRALEPVFYCIISYYSTKSVTAQEKPRPSYSYILWVGGAGGIGALEGSGTTGGITDLSAASEGRLTAK